MKYLLDTCLLSELVKKNPHPGVVAWLKNNPSDSMYVSVLTIGEIRKGITGLPESKKKARLEEWLDTIVSGYDERILPVDLDVSENWGVITARAEKKGKPISAIDGLLAATAYTYNLTLVSRNVDDFSSGNVPIQNPWNDE